MSCLLIILLCGCGAANGEIKTGASEQKLWTEPDVKSTVLASRGTVSNNRKLEASPVPTQTPATTPEVVFPDGSKHKLPERRIDLSELRHDEVEAYCDTLVQMPRLRYVNLGEEGSEEHPRDLTWEDVQKLQTACPNTDFFYGFTLFGKHFTTLDEEMDFRHIEMSDEGAAVREVLPCMTKCRLLDMDFCGVSSASMAKIRDDFPDIEVIWRIWFGKGRAGGYTARTNAIRLLASNPDWGGELTPENTKSLQYCTKVKYLDLGHNNLLTDISFVENMPDLEVVILAMSGVSDLRPLMSCPKLEYLEIQTSAIGDLRPLAGMTNLRHLNIAYNFAVTDITPLYGLTELERLWIGCVDPVPREQIEEMQRRAPQCEIDVESRDPTEGNWRYISFDEFGVGTNHPRYALLREQFDYGSTPWCYNYIDSDPLYYPHD